MIPGGQGDAPRADQGPQDDGTDLDAIVYHPTINEKALMAYDIAIDETAYSSVERDFQDINADLRGDEALEQYR